LLVVVVVVRSFERVVPESFLLTRPLTVVDELLDGSLAGGGAVTTVVEDEGGVGDGVTMVVSFSTDAVGAGVVAVVVVVRSQAASAKAPRVSAVTAEMSLLFMAIAPVIVGNQV
jgi:hypothetical protein